MENAYLKEAHLEGADLSNAHLEGVTLQGVHLEGAKGISPDAIFTVHSLYQTVMPDESSPEGWARELFGRGEITEEIFNKIVQLASGEEEEE